MSRPPGTFSFLLVSFGKGEWTRPAEASKIKGLLRYLWRGARHKDDSKLMPSLTCFPKEVLLDEVGLMHPHRRRSHQDCTLSTICCGCSLFIRTSEEPLWKRQDRIPCCRQRPRGDKSIIGPFLLGAALLNAAPGPKDLQSVLSPVSGSFSLQCSVFLLKGKMREAQIKVAFLWGDYLGRERGQIYRLLGGLGIICEF